MTDPRERLGKETTGVTTGERDAREVAALRDGEAPGEGEDVSAAGGDWDIIEARRRAGAGVGAGPLAALADAA